MFVSLFYVPTFVNVKVYVHTIEKLKSYVEILLRVKGGLVVCYGLPERSLQLRYHLWARERERTHVNHTVKLYLHKPESPF